ncbi:hypothetical protein XFPR_13070 [Xylella fastidiosa]|uniref:hypothetical protein n=1 Tax=Xylella fastidiosa TaxID=2371 RepID=UPI0012FC2E60|nr:hypothetical protein [Xylella fastidiosa]QPB72953.1 hypothetical protein XFPR_13070 [Xylella fastidiosa]
MAWCSPHHRITASPHHRITASPHHRITASPHHRITASPHHRITTHPPAPRPESVSGRGGEVHLKPAYFQCAAISGFNAF